MERREYERMHAVEERMWWYRGLHANLLTALDLGGGGASPILDAGCGTGGLLRQLAGRTAYGLDIEPIAASLASAKAQKPVCVGSVDRLPFAAESFAAIVSADVLAHDRVAEDEAVAEAHRCLRPGGIYVVNLPAYAWLGSEHDRRVQQSRRYTRSRAAGLLRRAGFARVETTYWNMILFPLMVLRRLLFPGGGDVRAYPAVLEACFRGAVLFENWLIRLGLVLPFGGSVLAVGVKHG
ncbi:MAG: class I SAM-dependent methyltransferase [Proteobacteria bacterium]|nr:class I SAM-dependent methyltransferase [Pseudomonadota bacterium]MBI3499660.1 class I SAM-dependent methyltransferase [Pseudomonadota bacterium]